jgi:hypothetical protein
VIYPMPVEGPYSPYYDVEQLILELDISACLIRRLAERLRTAVGADALEPELQRFLDACDPVAQGAILLRLDALVKQKEETQVLRLFRELFGATWDQAFDLYAFWSSVSHAKKLRWLQAGELHKLVTAFTNRTNEEGTDGNH